MAQHVTKLDDGELLIETDEEYRSRKRAERKGGCLFFIIVLGIIFVAGTILAIVEENKEPKAKTEQSVEKNPHPSTSSTQQSKMDIQAVESNSQDRNDVQEVLEIDKTEESIINNTIGKESSVEEPPYENDSPKQEFISLDRGKQAIENYYQTAVSFIEMGSLDMAKQCLTEMVNVQSMLEKPNALIDKKIIALRKKIEKAEK